MLLIFPFSFGLSPPSLVCPFCLIADLPFKSSLCAIKLLVKQYTPCVLIIDVILNLNVLRERFPVKWRDS